ncbi:MAG: undecaprenyl-phosphate 4-deoxy-4-formamido-L-arabinose transferase [Candidatus Dormibacteria bacterium]
MPGISVVVPVYNSATTLEPLCARLGAVLAECTASYEILLVDDGSRDRAWQVIESLAASQAHIRGLRMSRNYGQHNALLAGLRAARHELAVTIDDDLQNPPEEIPRLLDALTDQVDVVYGTPATAGHNPWRRLASRATKVVLAGAMGADVATRISSFRVLRMSLRNAFVNAQGPAINIDVLLTWATTRFTATAVRHDERTQGASNYGFWDLVQHAFNMVSGFSVKPLRLASLIGFAFTLFGVAVLAYVGIRYTFSSGHVISGFPFLASIIAIFSGAQLFTIGVIGEYLARMYFRLMDRPSYNVCDSVPPSESA